eukprot:31074-Pelagococcus_subviridis.AAC.5
MHVLIRERYDREPQREVLIQRVLVRVVRDVVHQEPRGAAVKRPAGVVRDPLELLLLSSKAARSRGRAPGASSRARVLSPLAFRRL